MGPVPLECSAAEQESQTALSSPVSSGSQAVAGQ